VPKRILIAEDETSVRTAIRTFIESRSQFEVCEAVDGHDAIKKADVLQPDLVVLDLRMPKANGIEVAALLHVRTPHTPVVIFTMFEDLLGKPLAKILGIAAVVPKSDGVGSLLSRIEALLDAPDVLARQAVPNRTLVRPPFRIYKVQSDGDLHFVEANQTFDGAKGRVRELGEGWPGEYVIDNGETGERFFVSTRDGRKN
jgi:DNA-binding response OmpR family regulator